MHEVKDTSYNNPAQSLPVSQQAFGLVGARSRDLSTLRRAPWISNQGHFSPIHLQKQAFRLRIEVYPRGRTRAEPLGIAYTGSLGCWGHRCTRSHGRPTPH